MGAFSRTSHELTSLHLSPGLPCRRLAPLSCAAINISYVSFQLGVISDEVDGVCILASHISVSSTIACIFLTIEHSMNPLFITLFATYVPYSMVLFVCARNTALHCAQCTLHNMYNTHVHTALHCTELLITNVCT